MLGRNPDNFIPCVFLFLMCDANGGIEIVVGEGRVQDFVAVVTQVGRLQAAWGRLPAVEEEDSHRVIVAWGNGLDMTGDLPRTTGQNGWIGDIQMALGLVLSAAKVL